MNKPKVNKPVLSAASRIDPRTAIIMMPCGDGRLDSHTAGGLTAARDLVHSVAFINCVSIISLARNHIAHRFTQSDFEWLVTIDSDIAFQRRDLEILLGEGPNIPGGDEATKVQCRDGVFRDALVTAEYARKVSAQEPVRFGFGFNRIHRSVFTALQELTDSEGKEVLWRFFHQGAMYVDYFPCGSQSDGSWMGEDMSFFKFCRMAGITPRIEQRTNLVHFGRHGFEYVTPLFGAN